MNNRTRHVPFVPVFVDAKYRDVCACGSRAGELNRCFVPSDIVLLATVELVT
jgi:hypothetical protein